MTSLLSNELEIKIFGHFVETRTNPRRGGKAYPDSKGRKITIQHTRAESDRSTDHPDREDGVKIQLKQPQLARTRR